MCTVLKTLNKITQGVPERRGDPARSLPRIFSRRKYGKILERREGQDEEDEEEKRAGVRTTG